MSITGYMVGDSCIHLCEKCIRSSTTQVELDYLNGYKREWEIEYWPVREKDGSTKKSPRGAVVMKKTPNGMKNPKPRTFDGDTIDAFSEYSYRETEGEAVECEGCNAVLIEAYECTCRACNATMSGSLAQKLDCTGKHPYCEECIEKLLEVKRVADKLDDIYKALIPVALGERAKINVGPREYEKDAYFAMVEVIEFFKQSDSPAELKDYIDSQLEKYEYLAHKGNKASQAIFNLLEKIDEVTYIIDGIEESVWWNELEDIEEMRETVDHYNNYGY